MNSKLLIVASIVAVAVASANAQNAPGRRPRGPVTVVQGDDAQPPADGAQPPADAPPGGGRGHGPGHGGPGHRPPPLIEALDTNHDGVIDAAEIANAPAALKTLDKNGDGKLTADELHPGPGGPDGAGRPPRPEGANGQGKPGGPGHRPVPPVITALDTNGDGELDATEIANASASLLKLDKNGDGQLTHDELRPPRPQE